MLRVQHEFTKFLFSVRLCFSGIGRVSDNLKKGTESPIQTLQYRYNNIEKLIAARGFADLSP